MESLRVASVRPSVRNVGGAEGQQSRVDPFRSSRTPDGRRDLTAVRGSSLFVAKYTPGALRAAVSPWAPRRYAPRGKRLTALSLRHAMAGQLAALRRSSACVPSGIMGRPERAQRGRIRVRASPKWAPPPAGPSGRQKGRSGWLAFARNVRLISPIRHQSV